MKFKFNVCLDNGSKYLIWARDEKEAYLMATEKEIESLRMWFSHHQRNGTYNAVKALDIP